MSKAFSRSSWITTPSNFQVFHSSMISFAIRAESNIYLPSRLMVSDSERQYLFEAFGENPFKYFVGTWDEADRSIVVHCFSLFLFSLFLFGYETNVSLILDSIDNSIF